MEMDFVWQVVLVAICLGMGGVLKGATGAGAPILAVPALVVLFDVHFAILVMLIPNILTNCWQAWKFRSHLPAKSFLVPLLIGSLFGVVVGTFMLATLASKTLSMLVAFSVLFYIALRLAKPNWKLDMAVAKKFSFVAGVGAGFLQGASGLSAPVSITFLNALRLPRPVFIATISLFFASFTLVQFVALWQTGMLTERGMIFSVFALIPISLAMPLGARLARSIKPVVFDRLILGLLAIISVRLLADVFL